MNLQDNIVVTKVNNMNLQDIIEMTFIMTNYYSFYNKIYHSLDTFYYVLDKNYYLFY